MKLIIGLGNPGRQYEATRHNIGFIVIDELAAKLGLKVDKIKFKSIIGEGYIGTEKVILAKPQTFMNLSGQAVLDMVQWYKVAAEDIIIVYDDLDLPFGKIRVRGKGSAGGHNGMKSIIYLIQSEDIPRVRFGIGRPENSKMQTADYVLGKFIEEEINSIREPIDQAVEAVIKLVEQGVEKTISQCNR